LIKFLLYIYAKGVYHQQEFLKNIEVDNGHCSDSCFVTEKATGVAMVPIALTK
jgi:hypothetical protein